MKWLPVDVETHLGSTDFPCDNYCASKSLMMMQYWSVTCVAYGFTSRFFDICLPPKMEISVHIIRFKREGKP